MPPASPVPAPPSPGPALDPVPDRPEVRRRSRVAVGVVMVVAVVCVAGGWSDPGPALRGTGLVVLVALAGQTVGVLGVLLGMTGRRLPVAGRLVPLALLAAGSAALVWVQPNGVGLVGGFIAVGAAATTLPRRTGIVVAGIVLAVLAVTSIAGARPVTAVLVNELGAVAFFRVGLAARRLRERTAQAEHLRAELEQTRDAQLQAATLAERQRLAREMHDVLAHSLSGLLIHLEGARLLATRTDVDPTLADTIERAHHLARSGLGEARQAIGMLRDEDGDEDLPGPERLGTLAGEFTRDTGIACDLTVEGAPADLGPRTRLTVYRVAQEALTNIRKHARPQRVDVRLGYRSDGVQLVVEDVGDHCCPPAHDDHGYGITGMRERAELVGGTLRTTPMRNGFQVALWVPA